MKFLPIYFKLVYICLKYGVIMFWITGYLSLNNFYKSSITNKSKKKLKIIFLFSAKTLSQPKADIFQADL